MAEVVRLESRRRGAWRRAVGGVLREWRTDQGLRLSDVAERAGVSTQYLSEVERGRKEASSEVLGAVTDALGSSLTELALGVADGLRSELSSLDRRRERPHSRELPALDGLREASRLVELRS
ncbi:MAG: helix-turn-helix transcriptional regulator, partial [Cellulomonas sp.]|nr:helix-turn-helix transcriptional regulator [Cellulomonas sp.]